MGPDILIPGNRAVSRTWRAPHGGRVRIEGTARTDTGSGTGLTAVILCRGREVWSARPARSGAYGSHDIAVDVEKGDLIDFTARREGGAVRGRLTWDPVITFETR